MRILVLASEPPWPLCYGGRLHCHELCRRLALRHELLLLAQNPCQEGSHTFNYESRIAEPAGPGARRVNHLDSAIALGRVDRFFGIDPGFVTAVWRCVEEWRPDVVIGMNYPSLAWLARIRGVPTICDLHDDETLHAWRELRSGLRGRLWSNLKSLAAIALFERRYLRGVSAVTVLSEPDARWCRLQAGGTRVECIPHGVDCGYFAPVEPPGSGDAVEDENEIIFWGGLTFRPNISAILHFADRVWPLLRKARPALRWTIVGWGSPPQLEHIRSLPGIRFTGRVDDLRPYVARAAVAVVPMVSGAGIKNKLMEAWAMARAVVCTPMALGSLPGVHGRNVWIARRPRELADGVLTLLDDAPLRRRIGQAARETAMQHCSWDQAAERLERLCQELTSHCGLRITNCGLSTRGSAVDGGADGSQLPCSCPQSEIRNPKSEMPQEALCHATA